MPSLKNKVFAIRVKLTGKEGRTVNSVLPVNHISASRQTDSNNPATTSTLLRTANDGAQALLPGVAADIALVPVASSPLAAAISGLVAILQGTNRYELDTDDLANLQSRLFELSGHLSNAPSPLGLVEQIRRDSLARILQKTSHKLKIGSYIRSMVAQDVAECTNRINEYLLDYSRASQMQMKHETHATSAGARSMQSPMTRISGVVTLVDATGYEHPILLECCTSFERFNRMLESVFKRDTIKAEIQKVFLATGEYDLCIDHGNETTQLTRDNWVRPLEAGTKIVMRIVVKQHRRASVSARSHLCHFCRTRNDFTFIGKQNIVSMHCEDCKRRFQISTTEPENNLGQRTRNATKKIKHGKIFNDYATEAKMQLIQNFHVKHEEVPDRELLFDLDDLELERRRLREEESCPTLRISKNSESIDSKHNATAICRSQLLEEREHIELMSRFETLESEDDERNDQEQEEDHRNDEDGRHVTPS